MKVILKEDIASLGQEGDIAEVARGYARNYLLPKGLAVEANKSNLKQLEQKRKALEKRTAEKKMLAEEEAKKLEGKTVSILAKVGAGGKLYGSVTAKDVAEALKEQLKLDIDKKSIVLGESIKSLGAHAVSIKIHPDVAVSLQVEVGASEEVEEKEEEKKEEKKEKTKAKAEEKEEKAEE